ncbi:MAG TPA: ABC transporter permease, partial [Tenuifilaceae bacterium]|nr:ABC transporter permease [Tenuifilaceae bacterium]
VDVSNKIGYTLLDNSNLPVYLFMSVIVSIFVGLTVSAEEIIKDRKILKREAFLNLSWSSYLMSKVTILLALSAFQALIFVLVGNTILEIKGMYLEFWLVLFSTWFTSNMLGLVISDSFKAVVTIYILIPFLVIPQIILSGIIVKYEKLNPTISSPSNIPIYGEVIVARWAYEALAVYQFKENKYQKPFYIYDEAMSISDFKRNYWLKSLQNKIDFCIRNFDNKKKSEEFQSALNLLHNEIVREMTSPRSSKLIFSKYTQINPTDITLELLNEMNQYLELVRKYYVKLYNKANNEKDQFISKFQSTEQGKEQFLELKRRYHNESLSEFVKNSGEVERIIEYDGHLIQKVDPIYLYPESRFIRSHFYAPAKSVFGYYVSTYWVNVIVIWLSSIMLYLILYYRLFKRLLDRLEQLSGDNND